MAYRDELTAARERIARLEAELEETRAENERLKAPQEPSPGPVDLLPTRGTSALIAARTAPLAQSVRRVGHLYYHPPATYFPLLRLYRSFLLELVDGRPTLAPPSSDQVSAWLGHVLLMPLVYGLWFPVYVLASVVAAPFVGAWCVALTPLVLLRVGASRLTFSPKPLLPEGGWLEGSASRGEAARLLLFIAFPVLPLAALLFIFTNVLDRSNDSTPAL